MTTYLHFITDETGDTVDIDYFHGFCAPAEVKAEGAWPCPESIDYTVYCGVCEERVQEVGLTDAGLSYTCERGWKAMADLTTWERQDAIEGGLVADLFGRDWGPRSVQEVCPTCGQPDNTGECSHKPLTDRQAVRLGAILPEPVS